VAISPAPLLSGGQSGVGEGGGPRNRRADVYRLGCRFLGLGLARRRCLAAELGLACRRVSVELPLPEVVPVVDLFVGK